MNSERWPTALRMIWHELTPNSLCIEATRRRSELAISCEMDAFPSAVRHALPGEGRATLVGIAE